MRRLLLRAALLGACVLGSVLEPARPSLAAAPPPRRIVSLNPCMDAILLEVADPGQIVALSHFSRDPSQSAVFEAARRFPATFGSGEEIVALRPDLVLGGGLGTGELAHVLPRLHIRAVDFKVPETINDSLAQVELVARLAGRPLRGEALAARIRSALRAAEPAAGERRLRALMFERHGLASGPGTLMDALMRRAGFDNMAARYGLSHTTDVPLEALLADPPEVLLAGRMAPGEPDWADRILSHPALRALRSFTRTESFPETLMFCGGPVMIPALAALVRARRDAERGRSR